MAFEHPSGLPNTYDRADAGPNRQMVLQPEGTFIEGAAINEAQTLSRRRVQRIGNMVAKDGDRVEGGDISVDKDHGTVTLTAGRVYARGDVRTIPGGSLAAVPMTGSAQVGIKIVTRTVTWDDDPSLRGIQPGSLAEGQQAAARIEETATWALQDDAQPGDFLPVYLLVDGAVVDQTPPPALSGILAALALYDEQANGHYIVDGCRVFALGKIGADQVFSVEKGTANIRGWKRTREYALRLAAAEDPDLEAVAAEPSTYTAPDGAQTIITVQRPPIASVQSVIIVKRVTELVVRGPVPGGSDALAHGSAVAIESIVQGATTFNPSAYTLTNGTVSWAPAGAEPAAASTYSVTYRYNASVTPDEVTATTIKVSGGVSGQPVLSSYTSKLPRKDLVCLDITGLPVYVRGLSARQGAIPPMTPSQLLKLAVVTNDWLAAPLIDNDGTHNYTYDQQRRYFNRLIDILEQFDRSELSRDILSREPVSKNGIFTDNFLDDFYRDQGAAQTAACNRGVLQLAIDAVLIQRTNAPVLFLAYGEEIIVQQDLATSSMPINPYDNFVQMPADMRLDPPTDFWTEPQTVWTSPETREFSAAPGQPPGTTTINDTVSETQVAAEFLREIPVGFRIAGFGVGENLATLTFDGVNVKPAGTQTADAQGVIQNTFTIPAGMPVGTRRLRAEGAAGSYAEALFHGEGVIDITVMRRVTLVTREAAPPITIINNTTIVNQITNRVVTTPTSTGNTFEPGHGKDPLAQTFTLTEGRQIIGFNLKLTAIGNRANGVRVQLANTLNGYPTKEILAEAFINMQTVQVGDVVQARFAAPVYLSPLAEYCFVVMTNDAVHALAIAKLGDVDQSNQSFVSANPYTIGVLLSSSNRSTWTPHNDADLWFQIVAAKYTTTTRTVDLWTGPLPNVSDLMIRAAFDIPTAEASCTFEIVRANGDIISLAADQNLALAEYVNETVTLRAVIKGSPKISATLYPGVTLIGGRIRTSGTYVTRVFPMGASVTVKSLFAALLPAGSGITVDVDAANDTWTSVPADTTGSLGGGWTEPSFKKTGYAAPGGGRVRLSLTGGPAARPSLARLRSYSI